MGTGWSLWHWHVAAPPDPVASSKEGISLSRLTRQERTVGTAWGTLAWFPSVNPVWSRTRS